MSRSRIVRLTAAVTLAALASLAGPAAEIDTRKQPQKRMFVALYAKGPGFNEQIGPGGQAGIGAHVEFIMALHADGTVPLGGPLVEGDAREKVTGILYFIRAGSLDEARTIALREPMLETGVVELVSVREFLAGVGGL